MKTTIKRPAGKRSDRRLIRNRKALLAAVELLIAREGADRVTVDQITATADLAKGTFYNYFSDKDAIAREAALLARQDLEVRVRTAQARVQDPAERFVIGMSVFFRAAAVEPNRAGVVARMYGRWLDPKAKGNVSLRRDLEDCYRSGRLSNCGPPAAVVLTVGVVQAGMTRVIALGDERAALALAVEQCSLVLCALGMRWNEARALTAATVARVFAAGWEIK
jgi:AcrR family transcriptional regulator